MTIRIILAAWGLAMLAGCVSPYKLPGTTADQFLVPKHAEIRSPFGTNGGFDFLELCKGPSTVVLFYFEADFTDCTPVDSTMPTNIATCNGDRCPALTYSPAHKYSQGQGGQILGNLMNAAALGGVAAAAGSAGNAVSSASTTVINNVLKPHYGHK